MKKSGLIVLLFFVFCHLNANRIMVSNASSINSRSWVAGDTIVMKNGTWTNQAISLKANGTVSDPIVLMAETAGNVILNGTSRLSFSGNYVIVSGLYFKNGTLSGSAVIEFKTSELANNCTLKNSVISNYNPADNTVDSKWVSLFGTNNTVDHCSFENKTNAGTLMVVWLVSGVTVNHVISNNYFGYRNANVDSTGAEINGQEIIRVGDSSTSMTTANVTVTGNYFEKCNGEIEVISNKSCGNSYRNNLFFECHGMLTLRHGNNCTVDGNYFFGNGVSESGGVRIIGENHKVYNNYFDKLRGTGYRAGICMVRGKENSALNEYFQVKNALVTFNTFVDCSQAFNINYNSSSTLTLPPIGSVIAHNHVFNSTSSYNNVNIDQNYVAGMDVTWKNNLMNQGKFTNFSYSSNQVITGQVAKMTLIETAINMYEPASGSALSNYTTAEYPEIQLDIRGRIRGTSKLPGASQINGNTTTYMPIKSNVGASYFNGISTAINTTNTTTLLDTYSLNGKLFFQTSISGKLQIFDVAGKMMFHEEIRKDIPASFSLNKGIYIAKFNSNIGILTSKKVIVE